MHSHTQHTVLDIEKVSKPPNTGDTVTRIE